MIAVVRALETPIADPTGDRMMKGYDLVPPLHDGCDDLSELRDLAALKKIGEGHDRLEASLLVLCQVGAVEDLEGTPAPNQAEDSGEMGGRFIAARG